MIEVCRLRRVGELRVASHDVTCGLSQVIIVLKNG